MLNPFQTSAEGKETSPQTLSIINNEIENYLNNIISQEHSIPQRIKEKEPVIDRKSIEHHKKEFEKTIEELSILKPQKSPLKKKKPETKRAKTKRVKKSIKVNISLDSKSKAKTMKESVTWLRDLKQREENFRGRMIEVHKKAKKRREKNESEQLKLDEAEEKKEKVRMVERHVEGNINSYE